MVVMALMNSSKSLTRILYCLYPTYKCLGYKTHTYYYCCDVKFGYSPHSLSAKSSRIRRTHTESGSVSGCNDGICYDKTQDNSGLYSGITYIHQIHNENKKVFKTMKDIADDGTQNESRFYSSIIYSPFNDDIPSEYRSSFKHIKILIRLKKSIVDRESCYSMGGYLYSIEPVSVDDGVSYNKNPSENESASVDDESYSKDGTQSKPLFNNESQGISEQLANLSEEDKKHLVLIKDEYDIGIFKEVPSVVTVEMWLEVLRCTSRLKRENAWKRFFKRERNDSGQFMSSRILYLQDKKEKIRQWQNNNMYTVVRFGFPFIIDMQSLKHVDPKDNSSVCKQIHEAYTVNNECIYPYHMIMCNSTDSKIMEMVQSISGNQTVLISETEKSYLDLYPKNRLVYLSPYSKNDLFPRPNNIYIVDSYIGHQGKPFCLASAKRDGITHARLPLRRYNWSGNRDLSLPVLMKILLDFRLMGDWEKVIYNYKASRKNEDY